MEIDKMPIYKTTSYNTANNFLRIKPHIMKQKLRLGSFLITILLFSQCGPSSSELKRKQSAEMVAVNDSLIPPPPTLATNISTNTKTPDGKKFIKTATARFKVNNVHKTTEKIEDLAVGFGGYVTYSNLQNDETRTERIKTSRDSSILAKEIVVHSSISLRVPNVKLDSFIRALNPLIVFLDYRIIKLDDVTVQFVSNDKTVKNYQESNQRQTKHIDNKDSKLKDATTAEDHLLSQKLQTSNLEIKDMELQDQIKYCNFSLEIYQKALIVKENVENFEAISANSSHFFKRFKEAIVNGWNILAEIIIYLVNIWAIVLFLIAIVLAVKYLPKRFSKTKE